MWDKGSTTTPQYAHIVSKVINDTTVTEDDEKVVGMQENLKKKLRLLRYKGYAEKAKEGF